MLPTTPQSIINIFFGSLKSYKKIFLWLLPLSVAIALPPYIPIIIAKFFHPSEPIWAWITVSSTMLIVFLSSLICLFWAICFTYGLLTEKNAKYKTSLIVAFKRLPKAILPFVIITLFGVVFGILGYTSFGKSSLDLIDSNKIATILSFMTLIMLFLYVGTICVVYVIDVLTKDTKVLPAIKKAFMIVSSKESIARILSFVALFILIIFTFVIFVTILFYINNFLKLTIPNNVIAALAQLFLFPLNIILWINFYHDLVLRFEKRK